MTSIITSLLTNQDFVNNEVIIAPVFALHGGIRLLEKEGILDISSDKFRKYKLLNYNLLK